MDLQLGVVRRSFWDSYMEVFKSKGGLKQPAMDLDHRFGLPVFVGLLHRDV